MFLSAELSKDVCAIVSEPDRTRAPFAVRTGPGFENHSKKSILSVENKQATQDTIKCTCKQM